MKRNFALIFIIFACLIQSACSYSDFFVVVNVSDSPVEVEYVINSDVASLENTESKPYKTTLENWNKRFFKEDWQEVPRGEYEFERQTRRCKIKLAPNEVLRITHHSDSSGGEYEYFDIKSVRLNGASGEVIYQGERLYKQFERKDEQHYFITYK